MIDGTLPQMFARSVRAQAKHERVDLFPTLPHTQTDRHARDNIETQEPSCR